MVIFCYRGDQSITFDQAVKILQVELKYPEDRDLHFVKCFDKNKDGKLSMAEFNAFKMRIKETKTKIVAKFKEYDKDGNGFISVQEASNILQAPPFNFPSAKEIHEEIAAKFDELDKDGNGVLSPEEVLGVIREYMGYDERMATCMMKMFDQNQDGSLDKTEFMNMWTSMFGENENQM